MSGHVPIWSNYVVLKNQLQYTMLQPRDPSRTQIRSSVQLLLSLLLSLSSS